MQEFGQSLSSPGTEEEKMKMKMMMGQLEGSTVSESSSSVMSVQKSSSSSQSTSKVSMSTVESSGDCEPSVVSKIEESCVETSASSASQVQVVDGEVKSSMEEAREEKSVALRSVESEGGVVREAQAASQETAAVLGEI